MRPWLQLPVQGGHIGLTRCMSAATPLPALGLSFKFAMVTLTSAGASRCTADHDQGYGAQPVDPNGARIRPTRAQKQFQQYDNFNNLDQLCCFNSFKIIFGTAVTRAFRLERDAVRPP